MTPRKKKKRKSILAQRAEYALYRVLAAPIRAAAPKRLESWSGRTAALLPHLLRKRHRIVEKNLRIAFPEMSQQERQRIGRECWSYFAGMVFRFLHASGESAEKSAARVRFRDRQVVDALLAQQRGIVFVTCHYGDWERGVHVLNALNVPTTVVARILDNKLLENDLYRARLRSGVDLVDRRAAARGLIRTLAQKGIIAMLADQAVRPREGILVPFLGVDAWTTVGPAKLALKADCPIVCVFACPVDEEVIVDIDLIIDPRDLPADQRNVEAITRMINDVIGARIRATPELWMWMHDRWKGTGSS